LAAALPAFSGCPGASREADVKAPLPLPETSDWTDHGPIFDRGDLGDWDLLLWGGFGGSVVKKGGVYHLYYQGARGYRVSPDEGPTWRAIGVATSLDGLSFEKHPGNPVLEWNPTPSAEEGAVSTAALLTGTEEITLFYGANSEAGSAEWVSSDARIAVSGDGLEFEDVGIALNHRSPGLWGSGDELSPIAALKEGGRWILYYIPNGVEQRRSLGVAWGDDPLRLWHSSAVRSGLFGRIAAWTSGRIPLAMLGRIPAWGMGSVVRIGPDTHALFLNDVTRPVLEVRTFSTGTPYALSPPLRTYRFEGVSQATVLLDRERRTWFLYYRGKEHYGVMLAPAGSRDETPPTAPRRVRAESPEEGTVELVWDGATDADTGVAAYIVTRNGQRAVSVKGRAFTDRGLAEQTDVSYRVAAVNLHGTEGPWSDPARVRIRPDRTPPTLVSVTSGSGTRVDIVFDEPLDAATAAATDHYSVGPGAEVLSASLEPDLRTVVLRTTRLDEDSSHRLRVTGVRDRAMNPNAISLPEERSFVTARLPGLVGAWHFDEILGRRVPDLSSHGSDGTFTSHAASPARTRPSPVGRGLELDGSHDHVAIDPRGPLVRATSRSHSLSAWARPATTPPQQTSNDMHFSIVTRQYSGLYYDSDGRFQARLRRKDGSSITLGSEPVPPGQWSHVAMVVDDEERSLRLYVDGQESPNSPTYWSARQAPDPEQPYYIGTSNFVPNLEEHRFRGAIDGVRVHDRPITPLESTAAGADQARSLKRSETSS
jgi:hypothetical protein